MMGRRRWWSRVILGVATFVVSVIGPLLANLAPPGLNATMFAGSMVTIATIVIISVASVAPGGRGCFFSGALATILLLVFSGLNYFEQIQHRSTVYSGERVVIGEETINPDHSDTRPQELLADNGGADSANLIWTAGSLRESERILLLAYMWMVISFVLCVALSFEARHRTWERWLKEKLPLHGANETE